MLGNVAASPLHGSSRSNQVSAISSALRHTPCCPGRRFGGDITIIEQERRSSLLYLLTSVHVRPLPAPKSSKKVRKLGPSERQEKNTNLPPRGKKVLARPILKTRLIQFLGSHFFGVHTAINLSFFHFFFWKKGPVYPPRA